MKCVKCKSKHIAFNGRYKNGVQRYKCCDCGKQFSEATFRKFSRHRFPAQIIITGIFFHLFIPARIVQIFLFFLFRCYVSKKTICKWTGKFLDAYPEIKAICKYKTWIRHTDEKQIKIKGKKAWWWNITDGRSNPLSSCISWTRHGFVAINLMKLHKKVYGCPKIMITDKLQAYIQAVKKLGRCKHVTAGINFKMVMYKGWLFVLSNLAVEHLHSKIDAYINLKVRGSFESVESANRWRKAFMLTDYFQKTLASQRSLGTFSTVLDRHKTLRELAVPV